jgi:signal transduction histidine kinase
MRRSSQEEQGQSGLLQHYVRTAGSGISRRRAQRTLGAARIEAELANRAKTDFLANMSHELRTPLNAIIGFAELITQSPGGMRDPARVGEYGTHIASAGRHLLGLLSDILDIAQIDNGRCEVDVAPSDIAEIVEHTVSCIKERTLAKRQTMSTFVDDDLPRLLIDRRRLKQVLINLLANACQLTQDGGCITLRCARTERGVALIITDNGRGMSEDQLRRALAPFAHLQSAYSAASEPLTLGLAIAKRLVELQGGAFTILSAPGEGTQVEIHFPAAAFADEHGRRGGDVT